jgi:hypothetical protein
VQKSDANVRRERPRPSAGGVREEWLRVEPGG